MLRNRQSSLRNGKVVPITLVVPKIGVVINLHDNLDFALSTFYKEMIISVILTMMKQTKPKQS